MNRAAPLRRSKPLSRKTPMRRKAPRRRSREGADPGYVKWLHEQPCVALRMGGFSAGCEGGIQQSHGRNLDGPTGVGRKEPDRNSIPMCARLHALWEARQGVFEGWSNEHRRLWMLARIVEYNAAYQLSGGVLA